MGAITVVGGPQPPRSRASANGPDRRRRAPGARARARARVLAAAAHPPRPDGRRAWGRFVGAKFLALKWRFSLARADTLMLLPEVVRRDDDVFSRKEWLP